jgi:transposase
MSALTLFVGIAVAKETRDLAGRPTAEPWQVAHAAAGSNALVAQGEAIAPALVVREAPGGFAGPLRAAWAGAAVPVGRAHPRPGRAFAQAGGSLANTARLDARGLAHCAAAGNPGPRALPEAATQARRALLRRRRPVGERLTAERPRLGTVPPRLHQAIQQHMAWWAGPLRSLADDWTQALQQSAGGQATEAVLQSLAGGGRSSRGPCWRRAPRSGPWDRSRERPW